MVGVGLREVEEGIERETRHQLQDAFSQHHISRD
jgi:hypothetical protein